MLSSDARTLRLYLRQAVELGRAELFTGYVAWQQSVATSRGQGTAETRATLQHLLSEARKDGARAQEALILDGLESLGAPTLEPETFLEAERPHGALAQRYLDLLLEGDRRAAAQCIAEAAERTPLRALYLDVFQPVQWEMGRLWELNRVTVAQEHYVTAATQLIMSQLYPRLFERPRTGRRIVVTCVAGDLHELAPRIVADFFEMEGWDSFYLGANTPHGAVVDTIARRQVDALAVSATMAAQVPDLRALVALVRATDHTRRVPVLVGGATFNRHPDLWRSVGADGTAVDAVDAVVVAERLLLARS